MSDRLDRQLAARVAELDELRGEQEEGDSIANRFDWAESTVVVVESVPATAIDEGDDADVSIKG